jgi:hypothetical protein
MAAASRSPASTQYTGASPASGRSRPPKRAASSTFEELALCSICLEGDWEDEDKVIFCDSCNVAVHQSCFGAGTNSIPEGAWYCDACAYGRRTGTKQQQVQALHLLNFSLPAHAHTPSHRLRVRMTMGDQCRAHDRRSPFRSLRRRSVYSAPTRVVRSSARATSAGHISSVGCGSQKWSSSIQTGAT